MGLPSRRKAGSRLGWMAMSRFAVQVRSEQSKDLLSQAGYPNGRGLPPLTFNLKQGVPEEEAAASTSKPNSPSWVSP